MGVTNKSLVTFMIVVSVVGSASLALGQPNTQPARSDSSEISSHREAALRRCTDGIQFDTERYIGCMLREGEPP